MEHASDLISHPLAYVRAQRGWSLSDVAALVRRQSGLNMAAHRQKVYRWEHGLAVPEHAAQLAIATELGISTRTVHDFPWPGWLLLADGTDTVARPWTATTAAEALTRMAGASLDRRTFLTLSSVALAGVAEDWQNTLAPKLASAADGGTVDDEIVTWVEGRLPQLWRLDDLIGGKACLEPAIGDLRLVSRLISQSRYRERVEQRLFGVAGQLCRFTGWAAFDAGRHAAAERYWQAGLRASAQAGDAETGAYILSQMAMQRTYAGDGRAAVTLLESARETVGTNTSTTVLAMLDTWQARAHAAAGEPSQTRKILTRADELWERRIPEDDPPFIYWMRRPSLTIEAGMALVATGEPETAARLLEEGMTERTSDYGRDVVLGLAAIAHARYEHGDLAGALRTAHEAVDFIADVTSARVLDELDSFARRLPANEPTAIELRERFASRSPSQTN